MQKNKHDLKFFLNFLKNHWLFVLIFITAIILHILVFKELGYNLSWGTSTSKCGCKELSSAVLKSQEVSDANYVIFDNYYKILEYAENQEICNNKNKVKVYGTAFANIFPYLYF